MDRTLPLEIGHSRKKLVKLLIYSILFVAAGIWFICQPDQFVTNMISSPAVVLGIGVFSVLFFGVCGFIVGKKIFGGEHKGLLLDDYGVLDQSGILASGVIRWEDIERVEVRKVFRQSFAALVLRNPEDYINRETSAVKKKMMTFNYRSYGSPVQISANALDISFDDLVAILCREVGGREGAGR